MAFNKCCKRKKEKPMQMKILRNDPEELDDLEELDEEEEEEEDEDDAVFK